MNPGDIEEARRLINRFGPSAMLSRSVTLEDGDCLVLARYLDALNEVHEALRSFWYRDRLEATQEQIRRVNEALQALAEPAPRAEVVCATCGADISHYLQSSGCFKNRECLECFNKRVNGPDRPPGPFTPPNPGIRWHG
jgi:hypothetical protein